MECYFGRFYVSEYLWKRIEQKSQVGSVHRDARAETRASLYCTYTAIMKKAHLFTKILVLTQEISISANIYNIAKKCKYKEVYTVEICKYRSFSFYYPIGTQWISHCALFHSLSAVIFREL